MAKCCGTTYVVETFNLKVFFLELLMENGCEHVHLKRVLNDVLNAKRRLFRLNHVDEFENQ